MNPVESTRGEASPTADPLVEAREMSKRFGGVLAVDEVTVALAPAAVHGLVGENGAGKSTLAKIIGGSHVPDAGELLMEGQPVSFHSPRDALAAGIATIAQEIALVPAGTVLENVFLGIEPRRLGVVRRRELRERFEEVADRTGFGVHPDTLVRDLKIADQQKVEIMRAVARDARLIVMDEPTSALTRDESERLLEIVRLLVERRTSILLVSHFLDQVLSVCDSVSVMRDGRLVRTAPVAEETAESLVEAMIGHPVELNFPPKAALPPQAPVVLEARGLTRTGAIEDVSLTVRAGEIVGLAGLVGSGRSEIARVVFGADPLDAGEVLIDGTPVRVRNPRDASRHGIAMLPESRKDQGLLMMRSIRENETLAALPDFARFSVVRRRRERVFARSHAARVDVRASSVEAPVASLSGGNQQKVLFAKWLARRPSILLADEPTRGVDVGAKAQIYELLMKLAGEGMGILLISSEIEEVLGLSHRVLVVRGGRIVDEFTGEEITQEAVMAAAFGATKAA